MYFSVLSANDEESIFSESNVTVHTLAWPKETDGID